MFLFVFHVFTFILLAADTTVVAWRLGLPPKGAAAAAAAAAAAGKVVLTTAALLGASTFPPPLTPQRPPSAFAANLPESNGAIGNKRGTKEALAPIKAMQASARQAIKLSTSSSSNNPLTLTQLKSLLDDPLVFPASEKGFKRAFDEFSVDVSYKQQYLDKNAFVVYYTKGFDGPGRASIEKQSDSEELQTKQYFLRNEAWISLDDARAECDYLLSQNDGSAISDDLNSALNKLENSISQYVSLAPVTFQ